MASLARANMLVLLYNDLFGLPVKTDSDPTPAGCEFTTDRRRYNAAAIVVFHLPSLLDFPLSYVPTLSRRLLKISPAAVLKAFFGIRKRPRQVWVGFWQECSRSIYYRALLNDATFLRQFDICMSYRRDADVLRGYLPAPDALATFSSPASPKTGLINAFISSRLNQSGRLAYLKELMKYIPVDSYGTQLRTVTFQEDRRKIHRGNVAKKQIIPGYKFTIAFENACATDYVTEKFFDPLLAGSVPVYLGAPNVEDFAPGDGCYINATDFDSPRALAEHLTELDRDPRLYQHYFDWRHQPLRPGFVDLVERQRNWPTHMVDTSQTILAGSR
jgi:hypothetical protein